MERSASQPRPARRARRASGAPDRHGGVRRGRATRSGRDAGPPAAPAVAAQAAYESAMERIDARRRRARRAPPASTAAGRRALVAGERRLEHVAGRIHGHGRAREGLYRAPATSSRSCCRSGSMRRSTCRPFSLYRALRRVNPVAVPLLSRLRRLPDRLLLARNPGAGARRQGHHPPDRRHPPARRDPRARTRRWRRSCSPTRRSAPSI